MSISSLMIYEHMPTRIMKNAWFTIPQIVHISISDVSWLSISILQNNVYIIVKSTTKINNFTIFWWTSPLKSKHWTYQSILYECLIDKSLSHYLQSKKSFTEAQNHKSRVIFTICNADASIINIVWHWSWLYTMSIVSQLHFMDHMPT